MEYYSSLKRNALSSHEKTRRKPKCVLLSERSQATKARHCMIPTTGHSGKGKTTDSKKKKKKISGCQALGNTEMSRHST